MKIVNKGKFIARILEIIILIATIIVTPLAVKYATAVRGYKGFGGEYLIPIISLLAIIVIEDIYQEIRKKKKKENKNGKIK